MYRSFNPGGPITPRQFFVYQLSLIKAAMTNNCILMGDFNLDWNLKGVHSYAFKNYFRDMDEVLGEFNLVQLINTWTWSRIVQGVQRQSILDHVYSTNPLSITDLKFIKPIFGDHLLVTLKIDIEKPKETITYKRAWSKYSKNELCDKLSEEDWDSLPDTVQSCWDVIENKIINIVDSLIPIVPFSNNTYCVEQPPPHVKRKLNIRKRLLKRQKTSNTPALSARIKTLNKEIRDFFQVKKSKKVRKTIIPGNTKSLWTAVKIAKDVNVSHLPETFYENNQEIQRESLPDRFASFFDEKIKSLLQDVRTEENVYNGFRKIEAENKMFMTKKDILECMKSLKCKNSEGFDRIPQRVLVDGVEHLINPFTELFALIYKEMKIPEQWKVARTIPIFKIKDDVNDVKNYRPIANLCSASKIFEKLVLKRIMELQDINEVDLTGQNQHGFKKKRGTSTLSIELQSIIGRALDKDEYVLLSSLDLSAAFDLVDIKLLIKRLHIIGLPGDIINLIKEWLSNRHYYVDIEGENSCLFDLLLGTVQGSILGPILYAIYVSPMFDKHFLLAFADDTFIPKFNTSLPNLIESMEKTIEAITKWLKKSGLLVNEAKTELCLFHRNDVAPITIRINNCNVKSKKVINVLGVLFDSKLSWAPQVELSISKANRALNAIKIIRKFFNSKELIQILTSNFYSILFYNSEVWYMHSLNQSLKHSIFVASSLALKMSLHYPQVNHSYNDLHVLTKRATPNMYCDYKNAILLYKTFNDRVPYDEWLNLNLWQINTSRQTSFITTLQKQYNVGYNILNNKFYTLNRQIPLEWFNKSLDSFKVACKNKFLKFN